MRRNSVSGASRATAEGVWMVSAVAGSAIFAGNDQVVPLSWLQEEGVMVAVAPAGRPVRDKVIGAGKIVPLVGRIESAVPPGVTVCEELVPPDPPAPHSVVQAEVEDLLRQRGTRSRTELAIAADTAVMVWLPTASEEVLKVATPIGQDCLAERCSANPGSLRCRWGCLQSKRRLR